MGSSQLPVEQNGSGPEAVAGLKRKSSFSSSGSSPKRPHTGSGPDTLPLVKAQPIHVCPVCQRPCWFCQTDSASKEHHQDEEEEEKEEQEGAKSQQQYPEGSMPTEQDSASTSNLSKGSSGKRKRPDGRIFITPKVPGFEDHILQPCGVRIGYGLTKHTTLCGTFGEQSEIASSGTLLNFDEAKLEEITTEFIEYERGDDDENALSGLCANQLLVREPVRSSEGPVAKVSVRKERWKPHKPGPTVHNRVYFFDWDIEPDVTYTVSINQFDLNTRKRLKEAPLDRWLAGPRVSCPYLTIEYKCAAKTGKKVHAVNQNACASIIWLYQRRTMRHDLGWSLSDLRHYSIILMDGRYEVWEARCEAEGFVVQILAKGDLTMVEGVKEYVKWSNAIHTWGLGPNATSFEKDTLELLKRLDEDPSGTLKSLQTSVQTPETRLVSPTKENGHAVSGSAPPTPRAAPSV